MAVADPNREGQIAGAAIEDRGVPVAVSGGSALFRMPEVRDTVAWLRALCDPTDGGAVTRALTRPPIELRSVDLAQLTVIARRRKLDLVSACEAALESPRMSPESRERLGAFLKLYRAASGALDQHRPDAFVRRLIERIGFRRQGMFAAKPETAERLLSLSRLAEVATAWCRREPDGSTRDFTAFVSALADTGLEPSAGPRMPTAGKVRVVPWDGVRGGKWRRVYMLGLDRAGDSERPAVAAAVTSAGDAVGALPGPRRARRFGERNHPLPRHHPGPVPAPPARRRTPSTQPARSKRSIRKSCSARPRTSTRPTG